MSAEKLKIRFTVLFLIVSGLIISRFLPFPPNFSPVLATAMFGGTFFYNKKVAYLVPLVVMICSDFVQYNILGYEYPQLITVVVYACIGLITFIGIRMRNKSTGLKVLAGSLTSSISFFIITNFVVWLSSGMYPKNAAGLVACYIAAIPYFHYTLLSGLLFSGLLYGGYYFLSSRVSIFQGQVQA